MTSNHKPSMPPFISAANGSATFERVEFDKLDGWSEENHVDALKCFTISARRMAAKPYSTKAMGVDAAGLANAGLAALELNPDTATVDEARKFFERHFQPYRIRPDKTAQSGFVTGYFEPQIAASPVKTERFRFPILSRPDDLVEITDETRPAHIPPEFFFARKTGAGLEIYPDRRAIEEGALNGRNLELFWFESRIDIFFIHIQGSARLLLPDGSTRRISYAGKSGHPFTAIGRLLIDRGELTLENVTMQSIRQWLFDHPDEADELMRENRSYIFFQEIDHPQPELGPVAAAGVPLTAGRSLAVDHRLQTFGVPIWVTTEKPLPKDNTRFARLMVAQDTGSAIVGPARGDVFIGTGDAAGEIAGAIRHEAVFHVFLPVLPDAAGKAP